MIIDSRIVNTTIRKANQLNYVIEDVEFVLNLARDEMSRGVGPGGPRGPGFPLESRIHRVKFLKIGKISFFLLVGNIRSLAPEYSCGRVFVVMTTLMS